MCGTHSDRSELGDPSLELHTALSLYQQLLSYFFLFICFRFNFSTRSRYHVSVSEGVTGRRVLLERIVSWYIPPLNDNIPLLFLYFSLYYVTPTTSFRLFITLIFSFVSYYFSFRIYFFSRYYVPRPRTIQDYINLSVGCGYPRGYSPGVGTDS